MNPEAVFNKDSNYFEVCPAMQGYVQMKVLLLQQSMEQANKPYSTYHLSLEMGSLRWISIEGENKTVTHANIISKIFAKESPSQGSSKLGRRGSMRSVLTLQVLTWEGNCQLEITTSQPTLSLWHTAIDLHFINYASSLSAPKKPDEEGVFTISTEMTLLVHNTPHTLFLSLLDDTKALTQNILKQHNLDTKHEVTIERTLLKEQQQLLKPLLLSLHHSLAHNHHLSQQHQILEMRTQAAEQHAQQLLDNILEIESFLPLLSLPPPPWEKEGGKEEGDSTPQIHINTNFTPLMTDENKDTESRGRGRSRSPRSTRSASPSYMLPTSSSAHYADQWKLKYDEIKALLEEKEEEMQKMKYSLSRYSAYQLSPKEIEGLVKENSLLKELSVNIKEELIQVQRQLAEIQQAARLSVDQLQGVNRQEQESNEVVVRVERDDLNFSSHQENNNELLATSANNSQLQAYNDEDWTCNYLPLLPLQAHQTLQSKMQRALRAMRWPLVEEKLWEEIYSHYLHNTPNNTANQSKTPSYSLPSMTMTTFLKFCKDFKLSSDKQAASKESKEVPRELYSTIDLTQEHVLIDEDYKKMSYSDLNVIYMTCSRVVTDDLPKKQEVFKVSQSVPSHPQSISKTFKPGQYHPLSHSTVSLTHPVTQTGVANNILALTFKQFLLAIEKTCLVMFKHIIKQVVDTEVDNLSTIEQKKIKRMAVELGLAKIFIPMAITLDILPWSFVQIADFLQPLHVSSEPSPNLLADYLREKIPFILRMIKPYTAELAASPYLLLQSSEQGDKSLSLIYNLSYLQVSKWAREYHIVPYFLNEKELYHLHRDLCALNSKHNTSHTNANSFPDLHLPSTLSDKFKDHYILLYQEQAILGWAVGQTAWQGQKSAGQSNGSQAQQSGSNLSMDLFCVMLGAIAAQQMNVGLSSMHEKVQYLMDNLERRFNSVQ